ncbi:hypothetical protein Q5752_003602 [Cryptotrichosporon argae]
MRIEHDAAPPALWPPSVTYLTRARLSPSFPPALVPLLFDPPAPGARFAPRATAHPAHVVVRRIELAGHPAAGQLGLFARQKIAPKTLVLPYLGIVHASFLPDGEAEGGLDCTGEGDGEGAGTAGGAGADEHAESDYDLSLVRLSKADAANPTGRHVSIGVDAARAGNAGRFVNDYRGVAGGANAEFRVGRGEAGELRMEVWSLKNGVAKGNEVLVSYGKGWWSARQ